MARREAKAGSAHGLEARGTLDEGPGGLFNIATVVVKAATHRSIQAQEKRGNAKWQTLGDRVHWSPVGKVGGSSASSLLLRPPTSWRFGNEPEHAPQPAVGEPAK